MTNSVRDRLINSAVGLVQRHGVAGTSVAHLLEHSGVARRSIYLHFPQGKTELITSAVTNAGNRIADLVEELVTTHSPPAALGAFVDFWKHLLTSSDFTAGCPIAAAAYGGTEAPAAREQADRIFEHWQELLVPQLVRHGADESQAAALATTTVAAVEGAVMLCLAARNTTPLDRVHSQLHALLPAQRD